MKSNGYNTGGNMADRAEDPRLVELRNQGKKIYSISKLNTIDQCPYQAYLNYIKKEPQKNENIYGRLGGKTHDAIELYVHGKAKTEDIKAAIQAELNDLELFGVDFPLSKDGTPTIRNNWVANMMKFADNFTFDTSLDTTTEELILFPIDDDHYLMGYIDAYIKYEDNMVTLIDWKTSSNFDKAHLLSAGRQLIVYKMALEKLGYKVQNCCWCMLKYCETSYMQKNGKIKTKVSEWRNMISDLRSVIEKALVDLGYDPTDIECFITECLEKNSWEPFPKELQEQFKTSVYYRNYEITPELEAETLEYIHTNMDKFETLGDDEVAYSACDISKNSYFCATLCGYGGNSGQCKYYVDYCDKFEEKKDEFDDLF